MSEVPLYECVRTLEARCVATRVQGYLAHKKTPTPLGPPQGPRHMPTVGS